jgi:hypothetical protein
MLPIAQRAVAELNQSKKSLSRQVGYGTMKLSEVQLAHSEAVPLVDIRGVLRVDDQRVTCSIVHSLKPGSTLKETPPISPQG